ncbi:MAG: redox-regulated ATPase YchF [Patescibacteria group bacterium]
MKIGLVGLPNVGKSSLFKALTKLPVDIANYPFCTIEPNVGIVPVVDGRLDDLAEIVKPQKIVPAVVEFVDIAGLVAGASKGEGLGNQFLSHIREVDAIANVLRQFEDDNITHVAGRVNPKEDLEVIALELILADLQTVTKAVDRYEKAAKSGDKKDNYNLLVVKKIKELLEQEKLASSGDWNEEEMEIIRSLCLLTMKPMINILNVSEMDAANLELGKNLGLGEQTIVLSAKIEAELAELTNEEAQEYLNTLGLKESGLNRLVKLGYQTLGLISYFTAGEKEVKAWTIKNGMTAPQAAGVIHTDFEKNFVKMEGVDWKIFVENKGWEGCREKGLVRMEGKEYIVKDGEVVLFKVGK